MPFQMTNEQTLAEVLKTCASLLSLPVPTSPASSPDPNIQLMKTVANLASLELLNSYEWGMLTKRSEIQVFTATPTTDAATETAFPLPEDFYRFIDQTQWNGAMRFPAVGPVAPRGG